MMYLTFLVSFAHPGITVWWRWSKDAIDGKTSFRNLTCVPLPALASYLLNICISFPVMLWPLCKLTIPNGACAYHVVVSRIQWKPFWLATQLYPHNDWTGWQNGVNYDVFAQAPLQRCWPESLRHHWYSCQIEWQFQLTTYCKVTNFRTVPIFVLLTWNWFARTNFRTFEGLKTKLHWNSMASRQK